MTREEEILKAARNYVSGITLSSPSNVIHFENGAKWADKHPNIKSLWHDASEEPQSGIEMLIEYENQWDTFKHHGTFYLHKDSGVRWKELCEGQKNYSMGIHQRLVTERYRWSYLKKISN